MTIVIDFNHFNTKKYTKWCCVPSFMVDKPSLNHFVRESAKNAIQRQRCNFACNFMHMSIIFDSNYLNTIIYNKLNHVPSFVPKKPSLKHFMRESPKNAKKTSKM